MTTTRAAHDHARQGQQHLTITVAHNGENTMNGTEQGIEPGATWV
jgi:hypothetical protein